MSINSYGMLGFISRMDNSLIYKLLNYTADIGAGMTNGNYLISFIPLEFKKEKG